MLTQTRPAARTPRDGDAPVVVVGYDGHDDARRAVDVAAQRAGPGGTLVIVRVTKPVSRVMSRPYRDHEVAVTRATAQRSLDALPLAGHGAVTIESQVVEGRPVEALIRVARDRGAREIVVGSRGRGRLRSLVGSVSHRLLGQADRPVVVVPPDAKPRSQRVTAR